MTVALNIPMSLFSGFFMRLDDIPDYLKWLTYVSYFRHAFQAEMVSLYGGNRSKLHCSEDFCYFQSPQKVLKDFGLSESTYEINLGAILLWLLGSLITFYLVLKWRIYKSR
jgi:ABC-2 type transporter.